MPTSDKPRSGTTKPLDAKLHQGQSSNTQYKQLNDILSSVQYAPPTQDWRGVTPTQQGMGGFFKSAALAFLNLWKSQPGEGAAPPKTSLPASADASSSGATTAPPAENKPGLNQGSASRESRSVNPDTPSISEGSRPVTSAASLLAGFLTGGNSSLSNNTGSFPTSETDTGPNQPPVVILAPPVFSVSSEPGEENQPIPLSIRLSPSSNPGETVSFIIGNIPEGALLSAGKDNGDGTWTLTLAELEGLTLIPPRDWSGPIDLTIVATSTLGGTSVSSTANLAVNIEGVASTPFLTVTPTDGPEDTPIPLNIEAMLSDTDGSETLSIVIGNVPTGAVLSSGIDNGDGTWTLTPDQLIGLTITPPTDFSGVISLTVTATSFENSTTASISSDLEVTVTGVASMPLMSVQPAMGTEDIAIPLRIAVSPATADKSETVSVIISNAPRGAHLSAGVNNDDGTWTLTPDQLDNLLFTPPGNWSGSLALVVTAQSTEGRSTATATAFLPVTVEGLATPPFLSIQPATGSEDMPIALDINAQLVDMDESESLAITIGNVPAGAVLSAGTDNGDGTWTLMPDQLTGLTFTTPTDFSGDVNLIVTAISSENGTEAGITAILPVTVMNVADAPTLAASAAAGIEDNAILLNIDAALTDQDGSEILAITIAGVPAGATLSAGTDNGDGTWALTSDQLTGLSLTPSVHFSGTVNLAITATASENSTSKSTSTTLPVAIIGEADTATLSIQSAAGAEDTPVPLTIYASSRDTDGSETLLISISGVPLDATLSTGLNNGNGVWTLTPDQLAGLTITPPANFSGTLDLNVTAISSEDGSQAQTNSLLPVTITGVADTPILSVQSAVGAEDTTIPLNIQAGLVDTDSEALSIVITGVPVGATLSAGTDEGNGRWTLTPDQLVDLTLTPPHNWNGNFVLTVTAISSENNTIAQTSTPLPVTIASVADYPVLTVQAAAGTEDTAIPLVITAALTDPSATETLSLTISGIPADATLSAGTRNADGTCSLTPDQLTGLTLTPPLHFSGNISLTISATTSDVETTATTSFDFPVDVSGVATAPVLSVYGAVGTEDFTVPLSISAALVDTDGSEILSIVIANLPTGASLSAGINNGDGTWTLTPDQLTGLTLTPPVNYSGLINLTVTATSEENGTTAQASTGLPITLIGVADIPTLTAQAAAGDEDTAIALTISAALTDTDSSENLSITISGIPTDATLSAGTNNNDGTWTLTPDDLNGLTLTPPLDYSGAINLNITATSSEDGTIASTSTTLPVLVGGIADTPVLSVQPASGNEDTAISLDISASLVDTDSSESLSIIVDGIPAGAILSAGTDNGDGTWSLTHDDLNGLTLTPPEHFSGAINLTVSAVSSEDSTSAATTSPLAVNVIGVATTPVLSTAPVMGLEDFAVELNISAALADMDGSETASFVISNVPAGATLSAGAYAGNGRWSLTAADLSSLKITPPANFSGSIALTVTAVATESGGNSTTLSVPLNVTVNPLADAPTLTATAASGKEDTAIPLAISSALADTDGSETLVIAISGVPTGAALSAGISNGSGTWTLTPAQLSGLKITPPTNSDSDFTLTITTTSTDGANTSAKTTTLVVTVTGSADTPTVTASNTTGTINTQVTVTLSGAATDTNETLTYEIHGVPDGFSLTQGYNNGNNTWTVTPSQLSTLKMVAPYNFEGRVYMTVVSVSHDNDSSAAQSAAASFNVGFGNAAGGTQINLGAGIGTPGIGTGTGVDIGTNSGTMLGAGGMIIMEDSTYLLPDAASLATIQSSTNRLTLSGLPTTATLSLGTNLGGGSWQISSTQFSQLNTLTITMAPGSDTNFTITTTARYSGSSTKVVATTAVQVVGVADVPTLSLGSSTGNEDATSIPISVTSALTDTDGSETLSFMVKDLPTGFTLTTGTDNGDGTWTLTASQISSLAIKPRADFSGTANYTIVAVATELEGDSSIRTATGTVTVTPVADAPTIATTLVSDTEDTLLLLNLGIALKDTDGSESISAITISGLPTGATLTNATNNGDGTWSVVPANLAQVGLVPPTNYSGDFNLSVTATSQEGTSAIKTSATASVPVHIEAAADAPTVTVTDSTGDRGTSIPLHIGAALVDTDGSETLSIVVSGLPEDSMLSAGINNGDGSWTLKSSQLSSLTMTPPSTFSGDINLSVTAYSLDNNATTTSAQQSLAVHVSDPAQVASLMGSQSSSGSWLDPSSSSGTTSTTTDTSTADLFSSDSSSSASTSTSGSDYDNVFDNRNQSG